MKTMMKVCLAGIAALLAGCLGPSGPAPNYNAYIGPPPPENYKEMIKAAMYKRLIDPTVPLYEFREPAKSYIRNVPREGKITYGWRVCADLNSKNRMGGYTGWKLLYAMFQDGKIIYIGTGDEYKAACDRRM